MRPPTERHQCQAKLDILIEGFMTLIGPRADLAPLGLKKASPRGALIQIKIQEMPARRFPRPWSVEEQPACFVVRDHTPGPWQCYGLQRRGWASTCPLCAATVTPVTGERHRQK